ncbi:MAG: hypothetical protein COU30_00490, partial [Candidatus Magasanikbacteria bacterium CG10_big_fil_rev_8_21_14_0_10_38_6]
STRGAITGIATATQDYFTVILAGCVVISVESISMAVGSYLSSKSEKEIAERMIFEEKTEIDTFPQEEQEEIYEMFIADGWSKKLAKQMSVEAGKGKELMLKEMAYRELKIIPDKLENPKHNAVIMGIAYVIGGAFPLVPYFLFRDVWTAVPISIVVTLIGLFTLGVLTTKFSKRSWWKAGFEMFVLASAAALIGYGVGQAVDRIFNLTI